MSTASAASVLTQIGLGAVDGTAVDGAAVNGGGHPAQQSRAAASALSVRLPTALVTGGGLVLLLLVLLLLLLVVSSLAAVLTGAAGARSPGGGGPLQLAHPQFRQGLMRGTHIFFFFCWINSEVLDVFRESV